MKYLGFAWIYPDGQRRYFAFKVLPFGLSSACYLFTKMFRPLVARWREKGIASIMYIDDGIAGNSSKERAINASKLVKKDLMEAGWKANEVKSHWEPTQIGEWLGVIVNTIKAMFVVPEKKVSKAKAILGGLIRDFPFVKVLDAGQLAGFLISFTLTMGSVTCIFTRRMYSCIQSKTTS